MGDIFFKTPYGEILNIKHFSKITVGFSEPLQCWLIELAFMDYTHAQIIAFETEQFARDYFAALENLIGPKELVSDGAMAIPKLPSPELPS